jgi:hypothetical protein
MRRACCKGNHVEGQQDLLLLPSRLPKPTYRRPSYNFYPCEDCPFLLKKDYPPRPDRKDNTPRKRSR